jgi:hypothetical protein
MPIHDWTRVDPGIFHDFHHEWISEVKRALNRNLEGTDYYALTEQIAEPTEPDVQIRNPARWYAEKNNAVTLRHVNEHRVVGIFEIMSPGYKSNRSAMTAFVQKAQDLLAAGVHLSLVDLFPPTPRDPEGIHPVVWGEDDGDTYRFDPAKPLTCASYIGGPYAEAFVEPVAVEEALPSLALFLTPLEYVPVPLEMTYGAAYEAVPDYWRAELMSRTR